MVGNKKINQPTKYYYAIAEYRLKPHTNLFLGPPVHIARWAHMHRFLSVRPSITLLKIHISESIIGRSLKLYQFKVFVCVSVISGRVRIIAQMQSIGVLISLTGRAHCQRQVAYFGNTIWLI